MDESSRLGKHIAARRRAQDQRFCALSGLFLPGVLLLISGCLDDNRSTSPTSEAGNHPPIIKALAILPNPAILIGPLTVRVEAQDLDSDTVNFRYRWFINGKLISDQTRETFSPALLKRGDQLTVEVTPYDGTTDGVPYVSAPVSIVNTAPILSSLSVDFDRSAQGRQLRADVEVLDPDNDPVTMTYRWRKNETVLKEGEDNTLDLANVTAKDTVQVEVTASDGTPQGTTTVVERFTLSNSSPSIVSSPSPSPNGDQYEYLVRATDADGDPITYALEVSPPGMTIEAETGHIHWVITPEAKGSYRVRVVAKDPQGGFATQDFDLSVKATARS